MAQGKFVSYLRVSTDRQGRSGLGLEAQRQAVETYLNGGDWELLQEFVEVESGKKDDRPKLSTALRLCEVTGATLVIAKLDRLSRDAHFLLGLQKGAVKFVAADIPEANNLTVGILALVAQQEREATSRRTREALAAAKRRGVKLGNPNGAAALRRARKGNKVAVSVIKANAQVHAERLRPVIKNLQSDGVASVRGLSAALNERGILTPRGKSWHPTSVRRLLERLCEH